jgi:hypothetical protein
MAKKPNLYAGAYSKPVKIEDKRTFNRANGRPPKADNMALARKLDVNSRLSAKIER